MATSSNHTPHGSRTFPEIYRRFKKRQQPIVLNGLNSSVEDKNNDFLCPICFEIIEEAHITKCGHTFCYKCINASLEQTNRCPKCNYVIEKMDHIFPNFLLNELVTKYKQRLAANNLKLDLMSNQSDLRELVIQESDNLELHDITYILELLLQKKQQLESDCRVSHLQLLSEFLCQVTKHKREQLEKLQHELSVLQHDAACVEKLLKDHQSDSGSLTKTKRALHNDSRYAKENCLSPIEKKLCEPDDAWPLQEACCSTSFLGQDGFNGSQHSKRQQWFNTTMAAKRKRMHLQFEDLEQCYMSTRAKELHPSFKGDISMDGLEEFTESLSKFIKYSSFRPLATLSYASDLFNNTSIVSSIEFDKDNEYFAIAGVTKKIKVFEYGTVIKDMVDIHYPVIEMVCNSKISSISWSSYHKGMLASSDYEGSVTVWDAFTGQKVHMFQEHEKRCWSVDFNKVDTKLIASGSDDAKVKLWSTSQDHSITSLEAKANVCCVKFSPDSRYHLTFGSADHCVHYYDLRKTNKPLGVFRGHKKAVSYVKFLNSQEIVSASTDSQLKLWNVNQANCIRSFNGHANEKNFVGLSTDGNYIACGSENNALYIYYKGLSKQLLTYKFDTIRNVLEKDKKEEDMNEFVSAVCWRTGSNIVIAANSQGTIKILELV